jgi:Fanconi anemia group M protein
MNNINIIIDQRERASQIISNLKDLSSNKIKVNIDLKQLSIGDYILGEDLVIERKTIKDLESSIIDGRLFAQLEALKNIKRSLIILEGNLDLISNNSTRINKKALYGLISSICLKYRIPIIYTKNQKETAFYLFTIAKKEQLLNKRSPKLRFEKQKMTYQQRLLFIVESFPNIGPNLAKSILKEFKTIKSFINADTDQLLKVDKLGPKKAKQIQYLVNRDF